MYSACKHCVMCHNRSVCTSCNFLKDNNQMICKYYVWRIGSNSPVYIHETEMEANNEAKRLASVSPGFIFIVLQSLGEYVVAMPTPVYTQHINDIIPF